MSDQQQENEITTTQAAPAAPVASDQVAAPAQASAPETPKAASTPTPSAAEKAVPATGEEAAPAKPKRTRRTVKPATDGEEVTKPKRRTTRTTRAKRAVAADSSAPISDEVAQARALAQISEAQVVRARRRAAEREAAALTELAAPSVPETPVADQPTEKPVPRTRRRTAAKAEQVADQVTPELTEASVRSAAGEGTSPVEPAAPVEASEVPVVDPALRPHRRGRKPKAFVEAEKAAAAAAAARDAAATAESATAADASVQDATTSEAAPADVEPADVRPGRSHRTAAKRTSKAKAAKKGASEDSAETTADASIDAAEPQDVEQPASEKPKRGRKKSAKAKASEHQADVEAQVDSGAEANEAAAANADAAATAGAAPAEAEDGARPNRRQHKRNDERNDRNERKDERNNDRRNRQRDRKQRNKERNAAPTEPTLSREELAAMKVAELREKAKEFEIETTGKKKAELVEEIYVTAAKAEGFRDIKGILQIRPDSSGIIHAHGYMKSNDDAFVPAYLIRSARLRTGDVIEGSLRPSRGGDKRAGLAKITTVNGLDPEQIRNRPKFGDLTPVYPNEPLRMEHGKDSITGRAIDIVSPIGKGQRGLIVSPPKAGKTITLQNIANAIATNNPEVHLMVVLVDERPEEVTDMERTVQGEVISSTFDRPASDHTTVAELAIERAKRLVELGQDVVVLLDSMTRLARAYNIAAPASGRILSGGVDAQALYPPKKFFGAARNIENGGSLTIISSALVETGSKMDEVIFEEFKGTGNMELRLSRELADKRLFPAIDVNASGTRREELITDPQELPIIYRLRRLLGGLEPEQAYQTLVPRLKKTATNRDFMASLIQQSGNATNGN